MQLKEYLADKNTEIQLKTELQLQFDGEKQEKEDLIRLQTDQIASISLENTEKVSNISKLRTQLDQEIDITQALKQKNDEMVAIILAISSECANKLNEVNELSGRIPGKLEDEYEIIEAEEELAPSKMRQSAPVQVKRTGAEGKSGRGGHAGGRMYESQTNLELIDFGKYLQPAKSDSGFCKLRAVGMWSAHDLDISEVRFHDQQICSASGDGTVKVWELSGIQKASYTYQSEALLCMDMNEKVVCAGTVGGATVLWDSRKKKILRVLTGHTNRVTGVKLMNTAAITVSHDCTLKVWDVNKASYRETYNTDESCTSLCMLGVSIAVGLRNGTVDIWSSSQPRKTASISVCESAITSVEVTPIDSTLLINCKDSRVRLVDLRMMGVKQSLAHKDYMNGSPYGRASMSWSGLVAAGGLDGKVFIWKPDSVHDVKVLQRQRFLVTCCTWSGDMLCSADSHGGIVLWN